ncbi:nuclear transport factor 2 family protein [Rhodoblastus sp.]|uniref:nuclear transport factor 2 family protein n=1 Tax=Rhodoblastus sp. TaxID=1962975 RepID=UPI0035AE0974
MQSDDALRRLGAVDREMIEQRIRTMVRMHSDGNLHGLFDLVADEVVYNVRGGWITFPYAKPVRGKKDVAAAMAMISVRFENLGSVIHNLVIDGDRAAFLRTATIRHRGTGKTGDVDVVDFIRFRDGLVVEFTEIADSAALADLDES